MFWKASWNWFWKKDLRRDRHSVYLGPGDTFHIDL